MLPPSSSIDFYQRECAKILYMGEKPLCAYLSPTTCPSTTPKAVNTAEDMETAPRKCLGALSPKYMGWMFMLTPKQMTKATPASRC